MDNDDALLTTLPLTKRLLSLKRAARRVGKRWSYIKELVDANKLKAYKLASGEKRERLGVLPEDVDRAVAVEMQHLPPGARRPRRRIVRPAESGKMHPRVTC